VRWRAAAAVAVAWLLGWLAGRLPAPHDATEFWIGNVGGPYLVIGFLAGAWAARRPATSAIAGAVCTAAAVGGFYDAATIWWHARTRLGLPPGTPWWSAAARAYENWFALLLWGSVPWLTIAVIVGSAAGYLGHRLTARGGVSGLITVGAVLLAEPILYVTGLNSRLRLGGPYARSVHNLTIWTTEALAGGAVLLLAARRAPRATGAAPPRPLGRVDADRPAPGAARLAEPAGSETPPGPAESGLPPGSAGSGMPPGYAGSGTPPGSAGSGTPPGSAGSGAGSTGAGGSGSGESGDSSPGSSGIGAPGSSGG